MSYNLEVAAADQTLSTLETLVRQWEQRSYTLVTLAAGAVEGRPGNILTLARRTVAAQLRLVEIDGSGSIDDQKAALNAAVGTHELVSYAGVYVQGRVVDVAAYRE